MTYTMKKRVVNIKVLPGEPLDGTGRACIHLFVQDERGPFAEPNALHVEDWQDDKGKPIKQLVSRPTRGKLACNPKRMVEPVMQAGVTTVTMRTDDPRAVTCPRCLSSADYTKAMELITSVIGK